MTEETLYRVEVKRPWVPHPYQRNAVKFLMEHGCAGLFLDPG